MPHKMMTQVFAVLALVVVGLPSPFAVAQEATFDVSTTDSKTKQQQKVSPTLPHDNEEEQKGYHIAEAHRCYACLAISHQLQKALTKKKEIRGNRRLKDWEYTETMEEVCDKTDVWSEYGTKKYGDRNVLQGEGIPEKEEGLEANAPVISMIATRKGGYWGHRLQSRCNEILGDAGEDALYQLFESKASLARQFCEPVCGKEDLNSALDELALAARAAAPPEPQETPPPTKVKRSKPKGKKGKKKGKPTHEEL